MLRPTACLLISIAALIAATQVRANDTTAELATGGLIFTKSPDVEMRSEDLFISTKEIRVQYRFFNHSTAEIVTQVAFPMPDLPLGVDFDRAIPSNDPQRILGFSTTADNRPVAALVERKALLKGADKTEVLKNLGVPLAPRNQDRFSKETLEQLIREGLIEDAPLDDGQINPLWTLRTTYYWQQSFPPGRELTISHRYGPSVGGTVPMSASELLNEPSSLQIDRSKGLNRFCIDQEFLNAMVRTPNATWGQRFLEYILTTGANWSGPIKRFRLVVDKGAPENLVSFCGEGVRKINSTQFELRASNFIPSSNVSVLILTPAQAEPGSTRSPGPLTDLKTLDCGQLWYQRNSIFKAGGYCFRTPRGTTSFGNSGCKYQNIFDVPLSHEDRRLVTAIQATERAKRCPQ